MFEMTSGETQAFQDAANTSAISYTHAILFVVGMLATIWIVMFFVGMGHALLARQMDIGEAFGKLAFATFIYLLIGVLIYF